MVPSHMRDHPPALPEQLSQTWRERAASLREWGASPEVAALWDRAASELDAALRAAGDAVLTLREAAAVTGLTPGHLSDLIRAGKLRNAGRKGAPRLRRSDLPVVKPVGPQPQRSPRPITEIAKRLR